MRTATSIVFAIGMLAATEARADRRCEVTFVRVPDDVRLVIESWLKAEPHCSGSIELRVVPTDAGTYYLVAQRPDGRIHEREVPDAQSAGVLVASWVADDWTSTPEGDPDAEAPVRETANGAPSLVAVLPPPAPPRASSTPSGKWITLGLMLGPDPDRNGGFHLDIDLFQRGAWTFGVSGEYAESAPATDPFGETMWLHTSDWRLLAKVARWFRISGRATIAATVGVGIVHTETTIVEPMTWGGAYNDVPMESAVADVGVTIARELGASWALTAGPKLTLTEQHHVLYDGTGVERPPVDLMVLFGVQYRL